MTAESGKLKRAAFIYVTNRPRKIVCLGHLSYFLLTCNKLKITLYGRIRPKVVGTLRVKELQEKSDSHKEMHKLIETKYTKRRHN